MSAVIRNLNDEARIVEVEGELTEVVASVKEIVDTVEASNDEYVISLSFGPGTFEREDHWTATLTVGII